VGRGRARRGGVPHDAALVLGAEGWHQGLVGIVAAKLVDKFKKPVVVVGFKDGSGRGSRAPSEGSISTKRWRRAGNISRCSAGTRRPPDWDCRLGRWRHFRASFVAQAQRHFDGRMEDSALEVDAVADLADLDLVQAEELERLAPFGTGNSEPLFALPGVVARSTRVVGTSHLQMTLSCGAAVSQAIAFGMGDRDPGEGTLIDIIATAEIDSFRGKPATAGCGSSRSCGGRRERAADHIPRRGITPGGLGELAARTITRVFVLLALLAGWFCFSARPASSRAA